MKFEDPWERIWTVTNCGYLSVPIWATSLRPDSTPRGHAPLKMQPTNWVAMSLISPSRLSSPDKAVRDEGRTGLEAAIRESKAVGGSSVLLVPGAVRGPNETHEQVWKRSITEIRKVIPLASKLGIHVLIETVWNGFCYKPEQFRDYLDEINNPWVQAYYDIGNMQKFAPSHEWIRILGNRNVKLDVKDWGVKTVSVRSAKAMWNGTRSALS